MCVRQQSCSFFFVGLLLQQVWTHNKLEALAEDGENQSRAFSPQFGVKIFNIFVGAPSLYLRVFGCMRGFF